MTDVEKLSILDNILALRGVFVQLASEHLKRQHKPGIKDMVAMRNGDRVMLRMFHYILFLETEEAEGVWRYGSLFFRTEGRLLEEFGPQGLTRRVWAELRKHFQGAVEYVNTCKRTLLHEKESLDDAKRLYENDRFRKSFEKSVRSILRWTEEVRDTIKVSGDVRHIKWPNLNRVTSLIPFAFPPSQAHSHITEIREIVRHYVCNLYVLDLCDPTLLSDWREDDFANLQGVLQTLSPTHWALVVFFPSRRELSFLKGMVRHNVHHVRTGKWVRHAQKQATVWEGNIPIEECDRLYVIFNGENLADNTVAVYPASSPTKASRTHGLSPAKHALAARSKAVCSSDPSGQVVACFDVAEEERFSRSMWEDGGVTSVRGAAYGEMERNPSHLLGLLENFCKAGQTVFFFGEGHASVVWELLRTGRNVVALENEAKTIDYLREFMKTRVADTRNDCEFVQTTGKRNGDPKRDMYWKLPGNKRTEVWDFLFQPKPPSQTDLECSRRKNLVFGVLNGCHDAPREYVSHLLRRLEHVYFMLAEPLTLENYKAQFDEEDPFDAEDMEELSDPETFDFESMPLPRVVGQVGDEGEGGPRRYSTSPSGLKRVFLREPVDDQSSDDGEEERDYDHEPCDKLPVDHDTWQNDRLYFFGKHHRFTSEDVWGHNVVWHPRIFQPAVKNGIWVMAIKEANGKWSGMKRLGAGALKRTARHALVENLSLMNPEKSDPDVTAYAKQKLKAPSRGIDWRMPQPPSGGQHLGEGGGGEEGDGGGGGGDGSQFAGKGTGETSSGEKASGEKGSGGKDLGGKGSGGKGSGEKGSGGKGSGGKGSGGKRRTSPLDTGFPCSPPFPYVETRDWRSRDVLEGPVAGVLETGGGEYEEETREGVPVDVGSKSAAAPEEEERSPGTRAVQREEETQRWQSREVLETGGSECERHASESASVDTNSESAAAPGETHALQREEEIQPWPAREVVKGLDAGVVVIGTSKDVLHNRSVVPTTREGVVKGGQWTFVQAVLGDDEGEEEPMVEARVHSDEKGGEPMVEGSEVTVGILTDPQQKDDDSSPTRCGEEQGGRAFVLSTARGMVLYEAIELGDDSAATELVSDSSMAETQNVESSVEGGEVAVSIKMDRERKDQYSPSTRCGAEQGDRASVLSTGREMVLHEAIDLPSDSAATELVWDTVVTEAQNVYLSVDVGAVARQEGEFPRRAPEHVEATSCFRVPLPTEELSGTDLRMSQGDFNNGHEVVSSVRKGASSVPLSRKSLQTLVQGEWFFDEVVESYLALLANAAWPGSPSLYIFNLFFYNKLVGGGYRHDRVARWTKDVDIFSYEMVLIPVHKHGVHWTLLCLREQGLEYYDSLLQDDGGFSSD
ncbi:hypothetical protein CBR_g22135 [Chara braunii]|uniref:Ubiquitin-like protease family profile domain-containing protein n=1 Tax=Chara braunii TaxID=69332 RepID=A0A388L296_CHABU|nr:hypothetical protein CBR_g22135 [Chara braunii]|eukprot:GBG76388.1 hypothetical protein CBR_g22135 [Chara braunii]